MNESEYREVLDYLREKVQESDFRDIDEVASMETRQIENPKTRLEMYLKMLTGMARERSSSRAFIINDRLGRILEIESGGRFEGIEIKLSPSEIENFGISHFTLSELDEIGGFIVQLEDILRDIHNESDPLDPGQDMGQRP